MRRPKLGPRKFFISTSRSNCQKCGGYILLLTLFTVAMVTILTVGLARYSLNIAVSAAFKQDELQTRWGMASCQRFALGNANGLLSERIWDQDAKTWSSIPGRRSVCSVILGGQRFDLQLDDESSKIDLNHILEHSNTGKLKSVVRKYARNQEIKVNLRPMPERRRRGAAEGAFECWGQVFEGEGLVESELQRATGDITCWSSRLNFRTATDDVLLDTAKPLVGGSIATGLVNRRKLKPTDRLSVVLEALSLNRKQKNILESALVERSVSQSVWVTCVTKHQRRTSFVVRERFGNNLSRIHSFQW